MEDCSEKRRILFVTHYADMLGANRSLFALVKYLNENTQFQPFVLMPNKGQLAEELCHINIPYRVCKIYVAAYEKKGRMDVLKGVIKELLNLFVSFYLYFSYRKMKIELVHTNSSVSNIGIYISYLLKVPHVWHIREFAKQHFNFSFNFGEKYQCLLWNHSGAIITVSNSLKDYYSKILSKSQIITIYNGVNFSYDSKVVLGKEDGIIHIALVGIVYPGKHQDEVVLALSEVVNVYHCTHVHLHVFGSFLEETYRKHLLDLVNINQLNDYVTFYGYVSDAAYKSSFCHIGVMASEYEAFGRATIEYMHNGMIPIVSRSGANTEIVQDGYNGFLFDVNNVDELSKCLYQVISNYSSLLDVRNNAKRTALKYTVESNALEIVNLYNNILKNE